MKNLLSLVFSIISAAVAEAGFRVEPVLAGAPGRLPVVLANRVAAILHPAERTEFFPEPAVVGDPVLSLGDVSERDRVGIFLCRFHAALRNARSCFAVRICPRFLRA